MANNIITRVTKESFETLDYQGRQDLIKTLRQENNIQYGILFNDGHILEIKSYQDLRLELSLRGQFGGSKNILAVIQ